MKLPRFTLLESVILIAIVALCCAVPGHYERVFDRSGCQLTGGWYCDRGAELALMAEHPAPWMDEFREDFRRMAAWQQGKGHRLRLSSAYDAAAEQKRIVDAKMDIYKVDFDKKYAKFKTIASANGFQRPSVGPSYPGPDFIDELFSGWPILSAILVLIGLLLLVRRRRSASGRSA